MLKSSDEPFSSYNLNIPTFMESSQFLLGICNVLAIIFESQDLDNKTKNHVERLATAPNFDSVI